MAQFSYSRVECYKLCPFRYKTQYIDGLKVAPNIDDPSNALILGSALHLGIEKGVAAGVKAYLDAYPISSTEHENEVIKLEWLIPQVQALLPENAVFEHKLDTPEFVGFIDLLVKVGENQYELYDFKYSNNVDRYMSSEQLHLYKHYFEQLNPDCKVTKLGFIFVPKTSIRQKKSEELYEFRQRLRNELSKLSVQVKYVDYDVEKVNSYLAKIKEIESANDFPRNESRLCNWCDYEPYCQQGVTYMLLPKNERRVINATARKKLWIYGAPFSGKTTLADQFPNPLMLNTDGNLNSFTAPVVQIRETLEGRIKTSAWDNFKSAVDELQKGSEFETIVVDLVEDTFEHCRRWCYSKLGIEHESDNSFKAWDYVRNEFLTVFKKLMTLDYNIVLISHEDVSKDITKKSGDKITSIRPNIQEKVANKLAGMVDIVARVVADGDDRTLQFKADDFVFGGGRLKLYETTVPLTYKAVESIYVNNNVDNSTKPAVDNSPKPVIQQEKPAVDQAPQTEPVQDEPVRRRRVRTEEPATVSQDEPVRRRRRVETPVQEPVQDEDIPW